MVIDTLITPVITDLIKEMLKGSDVINGELVYITKEFPMIKKNGSYSNTKADYLLMTRRKRIGRFTLQERNCKRTGI